MRDLKKSTNSSETKRIRKILSEEARLGLAPNSESESEEVDLHKELYPLGHYINNREEMIDQMFSIIKGAKLKKMLPPILKNMPLDELKADCLIHLLGMSKKRIRAILEGREINSSSDSESHSDTSTPRKRHKADLKPFVIKQEGCSDISDNSEEVVLVDPDLDFLNLASNDSSKYVSTEGKKKTKRKQKRKDLNEKHKRTRTKVVIEASDSEEVQEIESSVESAPENEVEEVAPKEGKTLLEILELEMRARAIRALLKNNDPQEGEEYEKPVENQSQTKLIDKPDTDLKVDTNNKITPAKNFRKKKRRSDDVIVIAPKVVTIDLTDESEQPSSSNKENTGKENSPSSLPNNDSSGKTQKVPNDTLETNNEVSQNAVSDETAAIGKSLAKNQNISEKANLDEIPKNDESPTAQSEQGKSNWAQRWLESKEVKKVVSTSKICGNIRKKIKSAKLAKKQIPAPDEADKQPLPPQTEIEGSVVEYELLSKSVAINQTVGDNKDAQSCVLSTVQYQTCSETDATEKSIADQVQDVSSTKAENVSTDVVQDRMSGLESNEDTTVDPNKSFEPNISVTGPENLNNNIPSAINETVQEGDINCVNKDTDFGDEENCTIIHTGQTMINHGSCGNITTIELAEEKHPQLQSENDLVEKRENIKLDVLEKEHGSLHEFSGSLLPDGINTKDIDSGSHSLPTEQSKINFSESTDKNNQQCLENETSDIEIVQAVTNLPKDSVVLEKDSTFNAKSTQEINETETLEINITDEDRYIEDAMEEIIEQSQPKNDRPKESIIVIE